MNKFKILNCYLKPAISSILFIFIVLMQACMQDQADLEDSGLQVSRSGQEVYESYCFACHNYGAAGAPALDRASDWVGRMQKGKDVLLESISTGLGAMPRNGSCFDCKPEELSSVLDFMMGRINE